MFKNAANKMSQTVNYRHERRWFTWLYKEDVTENIYEVRAVENSITDTKKQPSLAVALQKGGIS